MVSNRLGEQRQIYTGNLIPSKSAIGDPIVRLDRDQDNKDATYDRALVIRKDSQDQWHPVKDVKELKDFLSHASVEDKRDNLGLWKDKRRWLLGSPDGKVQPREVKTEMQFWPGPAQLAFRDAEMDLSHQAEKAWGTYFTRVDPGQIYIDSSKGADVFTEPVVVSDSYLERVTGWNAEGVPPNTSASEYHLFK